MAQIAPPARDADKMDAQMIILGGLVSKAMQRAQFARSDGRDMFLPEIPNLQLESVHPDTCIQLGKLLHALADVVVQQGNASGNSDTSTTTNTAADNWLRSMTTFVNDISQMPAESSEKPGKQPPVLSKYQDATRHLSSFLKKLSPDSHPNPPASPAAPPPSPHSTHPTLQCSPPPPAPPPPPPCNPPRTLGLFSRKVHIKPVPPPGCTLVGKQWYVSDITRPAAPIHLDPLRCHAIHVHNCHNFTLHIRQPAAVIILSNCSEANVMITGVMAYCKVLASRKVRLVAQGNVCTIGVDQCQVTRLLLHPPAHQALILTSHCTDTQAQLLESAPPGREVPASGVMKIPEQFVSVCGEGKAVTKPYRPL